MRDSQQPVDDTPVSRPRNVPRFLSVRIVNILLFVVIICLLPMISGYAVRRVRFWWTGAVVVDDLTFYLQSNDTYLTPSVLSQGCYEPMETRLLRSKVRPGDTFVDVGANIGWYTVIASKLVGKQGRVIAFEPDPTNFEYLRRNVEVNGCDNVVLEQKALSDEAGKITLFLHEINMGMHSVVHEWEGGRTVEVDAIRLDDYLQNRSWKIDFVKIDVEGAEPMILEGMHDTLLSNPSICLFVEFDPNRVVAAGHRPDEWLNDFVDKDFQIYNIDETNRRVVASTPAEVLEWFVLRRGGYTNLLLERSASARSVEEVQANR